MPEIGEVARVVHYIRKHLVGKTLARVVAEKDENVFGKVGTSAEEIVKHLTGKKVVDARQQGKYFWMAMSSPPHLLMHFGMAGWLKFRNEETSSYKPSKVEDPEWPPKYWKFAVETAEEPKCEAAFVDFRRFARIRLIDCAAEDIRNVSPLAENGPDPVFDKDILTEEWLSEKLRSKKIPVKALLLDQANISGIGNWVGDEILYDAKIHPEQYSNTLSAAQVKQLHKSIHYVCGFAVDHLADSSTFPEEWLFKHRWGKGKKDCPSTLPNGAKFVFFKVGGRTSCVVPSVQKKTGPVTKDVDENVDGDEEVGDEEEKPKSRGGKQASKTKQKTDEPTAEPAKKAARGKKGGAKQQVPAENEAAAKEEMNEEVSKPATKANQSKKRKAKSENIEGKELSKDEGTSEKESKPASKKRKSKVKADANGVDAASQKQKKVKSEPKKTQKEAPVESSGRRRSGRVSGKGA